MGFSFFFYILVFHIRSYDRMILCLLFIAVLYDNLSWPVTSVIYSEISLHHNIFIISFLDTRKCKGKKDNPIYKVPLPTFLFLGCPNITPPIIGLFTSYFPSTGSLFASMEPREDFESREFGPWFRFPYLT
jgi:hypothetical protein